jgi:type II secretory pathway pseudopilin PulG
MRTTYIRLNRKGDTLIEVLVAIALAGIMIPALLTALVSSNAARPTVSQRLSATTILQQLAEETRAVRNSGWANIQTNGVFHPILNGSNWILSNGPATSGDFTYQVTISDTLRDNTGTIVSSGDVSDPSTKHAAIYVSWQSPHPSSLASDMYLTRWQNGSTWTQTTPADFNNDTITNITVTNVSGGEAELTPGQTSGTVTSESFNAGASVGFNYLGFHTALPSGTNVQIQIASNNDNSTWNYVGPDGTSSTFFTSPGAIPYSAINGRYFRYQATLTTSNSSVPSLNDVTISYTQ